MAAKVDWSNLKGFRKPKNLETLKEDKYLACSIFEDLVTVEATCPTGFESALATEINDKFISPVAVKHQGRVFFDISLTQIEKAKELRCADNLSVVIGVQEEFDVTGDVDTCLLRINDLLDETSSQTNGTILAWEKGLIAWNRIFKSKYFAEGDWEVYFSRNCRIVDTKKSEEPSKSNEMENAKNCIVVQNDNTVPSFRATCYRSGKNCHSFGSMDVAKSFGGAINDKFGWSVSMKDFDLEVIITIDVNQVYIGIGLTKESLFKRNIQHFGPTTLRATICAGLLTLADIKPGDIVVDPLCGGGSIPIEGAMAFNNGFHIGGEIHEKAIKRCGDNLNSLSEQLTATKEEKSLTHTAVDVIQWDISKIPLNDSSVDVFVSDLPFGKRSGSKSDNRFFYTKIMNSMARVVRPSTGRAVLLTQDKSSMFKAEGKFRRFWKINRQLNCNVGGLMAVVYCMTRTEAIP